MHQQCSETSKDGTVCPLLLHSNGIAANHPKSPPKNKFLFHTLNPILGMGSSHTAAMAQKQSTKDNACLTTVSNSVPGQSFPPQLIFQWPCLFIIKNILCAFGTVGSYAMGLVLARTSSDIEDSVTS